MNQVTIFQSPSAEMRTGGGPDAPAVLQVEGLTASYGDAVGALRDVSFDVRPGSIVAVLGNNGAGKSTLLRAICGMLPYDGGRVDAGSVMFGGRRLDGLAPAEIVRAGIVQVPEGRRVFTSLTVEENLRAGGVTLPGRAQRRRELEEVLDLFPRLRERRAQHAGPALGRRAADARDRSRADGRPAAAAARRAVVGARAAGGRPGRRDRRRRSTPAAPRSCSSSRTPRWRSGSLDRAVVLEVGRVTLEGEADELAASDEVRRRYLGVGGERPARVPAVASRPSGAHPLRVRDISVRFGGLTALCDVSLDVEPGTTHAIIGPNGAGKSTCLNVLTGIYRAAAGEVRYGDVRIDALRPHQIARLGIGRTFQNLALSPTGDRRPEPARRPPPAHARRLSRRPASACPRRAASCARRSATCARWPNCSASRDQFERPVHELSYGDRKRVELARAVCAEPDLLLLDEPVAGMNATESEAMAATIVALRERLGLSIVLVEHDMAFVMGLADRVTVLDFGRRIAAGTPAEVQHDPEVVRAYLGDTRQEGEAA